MWDAPAILTLQDKVQHSIGVTSHDNGVHYFPLFHKEWGKWNNRLLRDMTRKQTGLVGLKLLSRLCSRPAPTAQAS